MIQAVVAIPPRDRSQIQGRVARWLAVGRASGVSVDQLRVGETCHRDRIWEQGLVGTK